MSSRAEGLKPPAPTKSRLSPLAGCGKTRLRACFGKGTSLLVPICPLLLSLRGGFSRRGICFSEFFRNLLEKHSYPGYDCVCAGGEDSPRLPNQIRNDAAGRDFLSPYPFLRV